MTELIRDGRPVEYRTFDTFGNDVPSADDCTISVAELAHEHRYRYILRTKKGDVILRRMPCRLEAAVRQALLHIYPTIQDTLDRLSEIEPYVTQVDPEHRDPEKVAEYIRLGDQLAMHDIRPLAVVVAPAFGNIDDWDQFFDSLDREDRDRLSMAIGEMARTRSPGEVDPSAEVIAQRFGLRVVPEDMIDNLTVSQRAYWMSRIDAENRRAEQMWRRS